MRLVMMLCVLGAVATAARLDAGAQSFAPTADDTAIRALVRDYVNARELRDSKAIEALFTEDADQHTTSGEWRRGRAQVVQGTMESSKRNPGTRSITVAAIRFLTPDVAIADGPYNIGDGANIRRNWTTIVVRRVDGRWRIAAIRNATLPAP
jgi:uncharacterized protein (TIGR02246 family)